MSKAIQITRGLVGLLGLTQLVLGVFFWAGHLQQLIPLHMVLGVAFVLGLWTIAILSWAAGGSRPLAVVALLWGLVIVAFGMTQAQILPGPYHWVIRVLHLAVGIAGMGM